MLEKLELKGSKITYNSLTNLKEDIPLIEQLDDLTEDLLQIEINESYLVDVGFYPEFELDGKFKIVLIKDYDWQKPVLIRKCKEIPLLVPLIQEAIDSVV